MQNLTIRINFQMMPVAIYHTVNGIFIMVTFIVTPKNIYSDVVAVTSISCCIIKILIQEIVVVNKFTSIFCYC